MKKKMRCVLLIDDDDATNFINRVIIERAAITDHIEICLNGKSGLEYLANRQEDTSELLILLDINMPVMDGWEFLLAYQETTPKSNIKIIMLTTSCNPDDTARAAAIPEVAGFVSKPLTPELLERVVERYCGVN